MARVEVVPMLRGLRPVIDFLWIERSRVLAGVTLTVLARAVGAVPPLISRVLVDDVIAKARWEHLAPLVSLIGAAAVVEAGLTWTSWRVIGIGSNRAITKIRQQLVAHMFRVRLPALQAMTSGALATQVMADPEALRGLIGSGMMRLVGAVAASLVAIVALTAVNWRLTLPTIAIVAAYTGVTLVALRASNQIARERAAVRGQVVGRLTEGLAGARVVKAFGAESRETLRFVKGSHQLFRFMARGVKNVALTSAFSALLPGLVTCAALFFGSDALRSGEMTAGDVVAYLMFVTLLTGPIVDAAGVLIELGDAGTALERIDALKRLPREDRAGKGRQAADGIRGEVVVREVSFAYTPGTTVLRNVSLVAAPGSTTAIVGISGAGKTTLASLVLGLVRPTAGAIYIDGVPLERFDIHGYRRRVSAVFQDSLLFSGTVMENVRYGRPGATAAEAHAACQRVNVHNSILSLDHGYATEVGERGARLSAGQAQRIALARAILTNPCILVLDEATAHLDPVNDALVRQAIRHLTADRTTFVIAHRIETIREADQVLVLQDGQVVQQGTYQELSRQPGHFRDLFGAPEPLVSSYPLTRHA